MKGHLRLAGVQVGGSLNDVRVDRVDNRVLRVVGLTELSVVTPPGIFVVRSAHD